MVYCLMTVVEEYDLLSYDSSRGVWFIVMTVVEEYGLLSYDSSRGVWFIDS